MQLTCAAPSCKCTEHSAFDSPSLIARQDTSLLLARRASAGIFSAQPSNAALSAHPLLGPALNFHGPLCDSLYHTVVFAARSRTIGELTSASLLVRDIRLCCSLSIALHNWTPAVGAGRTPGRFGSLSRLARDFGSWMRYISSASSLDHGDPDRPCITLALLSRHTAWGTARAAAGLDDRVKSDAQSHALLCIYISGVEAPEALEIRRRRTARKSLWIVRRLLLSSCAYRYTAQAPSFANAPWPSAPAGAAAQAQAPPRNSVSHRATLLSHTSERHSTRPREKRSRRSLDRLSSSRAKIVKSAVACSQRASQRCATGRRARRAGSRRGPAAASTSSLRSRACRSKSGVGVGRKRKLLCCRRAMPR